LLPGGVDELQPMGFRNRVELHGWRLRAQFQKNEKLLVEFGAQVAKQVCFCFPDRLEVQDIGVVYVLI
jgi:hypothetical protein